MVNGYSAVELVKLLSNKQAQAAQTARALYIGEQEEITKKYFDDAMNGIEKWRERRIAPLYRNITQQIIDRSGLLFKDGIPAIALEDTATDEIDQEATTKLWTFIDGYEFTEKLQALDKTVRLLQSAHLLIGMEKDEDDGQLEFCFDVLHAGNSIVHYDSKLCPAMLVRRTGDSTYEVITKETITSIVEEVAGSAKFTESVPNPYGLIPLVTFHDRSAPLYGAMHPVDEMLPKFNLLLNKMLSLMAFTLIWNTNSTLFLENIKLPTNQMVIGPGQVVSYEASPDVKSGATFVAPSIDVASLNNVIESWARMVANAYSVRIDNDPGVTSGFQLIVRENGNLELRKERMRPFEAGFARMWKIMAKMLKVVGGWDATKYDLGVNFPSPSLPSNQLEVEEIWQLRLDGKRATIKDYLIEVRGLTPEEADEKLIELAGGTPPVEKPEEPESMETEE